MLLNLPTTDAVEAAVFGEHGVAQRVKPPQLVVDFSTVKVDEGRAFAARLRDADRLRLDRCAGVRRPAGVGQPAR